VTDAFKPVDPVRFDASRLPVPASVSASEHGNGQGIAAVVESATVLLHRLAAEAKNGAAWHSRRATRWGRIYLTLGLPAAILAAVAGAAALASTTTRIVGGVIALASAGFSAAAAFLDSRNSQQRFEALAASWSALGSDVDRLLTFDVSRIKEFSRRAADLEAPLRAGEIDNDDARERRRRARTSVRAREEGLQRDVEELLDREKELLAGKQPAVSEREQTKGSAAVMDDDW
jgi:hypothetical protein